jgi:hypothetical protein
MLDVADRAAFLRWLDNNQEDLLDAINQRPRSIKLWVADYARAMKSATVEMGMDRGHAGVFSDSEEEMGLHDPEAEDEEEGY